MRDGGVSQKGAEPMAQDVSRTVEAFPIDLVVDLVNEWGTVPRAVAGESDEAYPTLAEFIAAHPALRAVGSPHAEGDLVAAADRLHPVFAAADAASTAALLNELVDDAALALRLEAGGETSELALVHAAWRQAGDASGSTRVLGSAVVALVDWLRDEPDADRLGICEGDACADVYVDASPAGRRRFCSLTCQNRVRTRAYRAQQRAAATRS
ncbi:CGNR zinc finger domain-containing protein [Agromyces intestinalis]|nr:CGNR zinc finger domain-containing protein [Agromyces intestinalis]